MSCRKLYHSQVCDNCVCFSFEDAPQQGPAFLPLGNLDSHMLLDQRSVAVILAKALVEAALVNLVHVKQKILVSVVRTCMHLVADEVQVVIDVHRLITNALTGSNLVLHNSPFVRRRLTNRCVHPTKCCLQR